MITKIRQEYDIIKSLFKTDVFLYTMGKAGSNSISYSLEKAGLAVSTKHYFAGDQHNFFKNNDTNFLGKFRKQLTRKYIAQSNKKIKIISMVRDPLARNLSMVFFALETILYRTLGPTDKRNLKGNYVTLHEIIEIGFEEQINHQGPLTFFEKEFNFVLDLDVYKYPFDQEKGSTRILTDKLDILILKLEKLNSLEETICDFLNLNYFELLSANRGENYWYADIYKNFKKEFSPSKEYLDQMYESKYCRHFYSPREIAGFRSRWQK